MGVFRITRGEVVFQISRMMIVGTFAGCFIGFIALRLSFIILVYVLVISIFDMVVVMNICVLLQERSLRVLRIIRIADLTAGLDSWPAPSEGSMLVRFTAAST